MIFILFFSSSKLRNFHSFGVVTNTGEGLQILTYARLLWPLSSEGSLACHTECYTGQLFIIGHLLGTVTLTFGSGAVTTCFNDLGLSRLGFEH